jgi:hypothetical protein
MTLGGIPLYVFAPLVVSMALSLVFVQKLQALSRAMGIDARDAADAGRLKAALFAGETSLHDLGVHAAVWSVRFALLIETASLLLFTYLLYRVVGTA